MAFNLTPDTMQQFLDDNGDPLSTGTVETYVAGTSTPTDTYTDNSGGSANTNPIVLDSAGRANIWLNDDFAYKFVVRDSAGDLIKTIDDIRSSGAGESAEIELPDQTVYGNISGVTAIGQAIPITSDFSGGLSTDIPNRGAVVDYLEDNYVGNTGNQTIDGDLDVSGNITAGGDDVFKTKTNSGDSPGYLDTKLSAGKGIEIEATGSSAEVTATGISDYLVYKYLADTALQAPTPTDGYIRWNDATQVDATSLYIANENEDGTEIQNFFADVLKTGDKLIFSDDASPQAYQVWQVTAITAETGYYELEVTLSGGSKQFALNDQIVMSLEATANIFDSSYGTCLVSGGTLSVNAGDPAKFDVTATIGYVVDSYTDPDNVVPIRITCPEHIGVTITNIATTGATFVSVDGNCDLVQSPYPPSSESRKDFIYLGTIGHPDNTTINSVQNLAWVSKESANHTLADLFYAIKPITTSGLRYTANGANLKMDRSAGTMLWNSLNYKINPKDPNQITNAEALATYWFESYRDDTGTWRFSAAPVDEIDPDVYDDGVGTVAGPNGVVEDYQWQIIEILYEPLFNLTFLEWGQRVFDNKSSAMAAVNDNNVVRNPALQSVAKRGSLIVRGGATDLSSTQEAEFIANSMFSETKLTPLKISQGINNVSQLNSGGQVSPFSFDISSNGSQIIATVERDGGGDVVVLFGDENLILDTTPAITANLSAGTDTVPVSNFVYLTESSGSLVVNTSTSGYPRTSTWWCALGSTVVQSAATVQTSGALSVQRNTDLPSKGDWTRGFLPSVNERIRKDYAKWDVGCATSATVSGSNLYAETLSGYVYQRNLQSWDATDSSVTPVIIPNDYTTPYQESNSVNFDEDANGNTINNNQSYSVVLWGSVQSGGSGGKVYANKPLDAYGGGNRDANALADISNFAVYNVPSTLKGTAFLLARIVVRRDGGNPTVLSIIDLRGSDPSAFAGGGSSATAGTTFSDSNFRVYDDVDPTKELALQCSGITTAQTRTVTVQDSDGTIALLEATQTWSGMNAYTDGSSTELGRVFTINDNTYLTKNASSDGVSWAQDDVGEESTILSFGSSDKIAQLRYLEAGETSPKSLVDFELYGIVLNKDDGNDAVALRYSSGNGGNISLYNDGDVVTSRIRTYLSGNTQAYFNVSGGGVAIGATAVTGTEKLYVNGDAFISTSNVDYTFDQDELLIDKDTGQGLATINGSTGGAVLFQEGGSDRTKFRYNTVTNRAELVKYSGGEVTVQYWDDSGDTVCSGDVRGATLTADNGFTGTGAYTNFTITNGIITAAS